MSTIALAGAAHTNASVAGQTHAPTQAEAPGAPVPTTARELVATLPTEGGALGSILGGGFHPEHVLTLADNTLHGASDSVRGRFGGLVPQPRSTVAPGPAGAVAGARAALEGAWNRFTEILPTPGLPAQES